jgi:hypothetical protein
MSEFNNKEYLELINRLLDEQYSDDACDLPITSDSWIPAETEIKNKISKLKENINIDLSKAKKSEILKIFTDYKQANIKVDNFRIKVESYIMHDRYKEDYKGEGDPIFSIRVYEEKSRTPGGFPCKMEYSVDFNKDKRFSNRFWLNKLGNGFGSNLTINETVDIIKYMQIVKKLAAFL